MTPREHQMLAFVRTYVAEHEYSPAYDDIREHLGLASKSGVHRMVQSLIEQGHLSATSRRNRSLVPTARRTPSVDELLDALQEAHLFEDEEPTNDPMIIATRSELRETLLKVLA